MPSLRRALSTPSVRVSPYPVLPSSRSHRPHPHGHRRPSGSDVSDRKVLADIDWWRVADGQRERGSEEEDGEEERDVGEDPTPISADSEMPRVAVPGAADRRDSAGVEPERPSTPVMSESPLGGQISGYSSQPRFFGQLGVFAAGPRTPTRRTASSSSASSVESTPEVLRTPIERPSFAGMGFADPGPEIPLFRMRFADPSAVPLLLTRHFIPEKGGLDGPEDSLLADSPVCHDDLFA